MGTTRPVAVATSAVLALGGTLAPGAFATAGAAGSGDRAQVVAGPAVPRGCPPTPQRRHVTYVKGSTRRTPVGAVTGGYNANPKHDLTMTRTVTATRTRRSSWEVGGELSVGWGIAQVKAHANRTAAVESARGASVSVTFAIPPKHYGYLVPKVQTKAYRIFTTWVGMDCKPHRRSYGRIRAVVADLDYGTCITRRSSGCRP